MDITSSKGYYLNTIHIVAWTLMQLRRENMEISQLRCLQLLLWFNDMFRWALGFEEQKWSSLATAENSLFILYKPGWSPVACFLPLFHKVFVDGYPFGVAVDSVLIRANIDANMAILVSKT